MLEILIFVPHYLPGSKFGGPVRSVQGLVERLGSEFRFKIVTQDRDWGDVKPYPHIKTGVWQGAGAAQVMYLLRHDCSPWGFRELIRNTPHDILYLNSFVRE